MGWSSQFLRGRRVGNGKIARVGKEVNGKFDLLNSALATETDDYNGSMMQLIDIGHWLLASSSFFLANLFQPLDLPASTKGPGESTMRPNASIISIDRTSDDHHQRRAFPWSTRLLGVVDLMSRSIYHVLYSNSGSRSWSRRIVTTITSCLKMKGERKWRPRPTYAATPFLLCFFFYLYFFCCQFFVLSVSCRVCLLDSMLRIECWLPRNKGECHRK